MDIHRKRRQRLEEIEQSLLRYGDHERLREFFVINADMISFNKWSKVSAMAGIFKIPLFIISKPLNSMIFSTTVLINFCN